MASFKDKLKISNFQIILLGFAGVILAGALLLMLPFASKAGRMTSFSDTLFTATSAVCVTGLVVQDTGSYWSIWGKLLIILLIQIGGLGVVTMAVSMTMFSGRRIDLMQRSIMQESISAAQLGGIVRLTAFILKVTAGVELAGAVLMSPVFIRDYGIIKGIGFSIFHSISCFCNAGFDLLGTSDAKFVSMTRYAADPLINIVLMLLILIGGIGFLTWDDFCKHKFDFRRYRLQTKVVLVTSLILVTLPTIYFYCVEYKGLPVGERLLASFFQSITTRTAGFNTTDNAALSDTGKMLTIILMLIGGSSGSTAGGMKMTTFAVMFATGISVFKNKRSTNMFGRSIPEDITRKAAAIFMMYIMLFLTASMIISNVENISIVTSMYEAASAIATVGLTLGITPGLGNISRGILIFLMFFGRVGGLTVIYAAFRQKKEVARFPHEELAVG
ncbi:MAG: Trk family potassium uptake protein [Lachnospiraceae bacterium]|nr:Trk family potassium uptake protein [Lachnospiraceae bacterium]